MSIFKLLSNTVEGTLETAVNGAKLAASPILAPFDGGDCMEDSVKGVASGVKKIGDAEGNGG